MTTSKPDDATGPNDAPGPNEATGPNKATGPNDGSDDRWLRIETQIAHLQHFVDQLNGVIIDQAGVIGDLRRRLDRHDQQMTELRRRLPEEGGGGPEAEKPPHY